MDTPENSDDTLQDQPALDMQQTNTVPDAGLSDIERKRARLTSDAHQAQHFFITIFKGLGKIVEEISSLILHR